jgi:hypothetical protein
MIGQHMSEVPDNSTTVSYKKTDALRVYHISLLHRTDVVFATRMSHMGQTLSSDVMILLSIQIIEATDQIVGSPGEMLQQVPTIHNFSFLKMYRQQRL